MLLGGPDVCVVGVPQPGLVLGVGGGGFKGFGGT